ncbi:MAG TPA: hypothetical protein VFA12_20520 [Stellaceae bacterium]|nr:hypothetical protein [Stellaceae bacterium]
MNSIRRALAMALAATAAALVRLARRVMPREGGKDDAVRRD